MNNINNPNHFPYYPGMYMPPMQINNQNPAYFNEYQNFYYLNPPSYPLNQQMMGNPYYPPFMIPQNSLEDSLNIIYNRGIVNNIIGAFFIKECQERQKQRKSEKRKVPISTVQLNYDPENENMDNNNNGFNNNDIGEESNNKLSYKVNDFKLKTENNNINNNENADDNNLKNNEQGENVEKKEEEEKKEENIDNDENELKKPSMM